MAPGAKLRKGAPANARTWTPPTSILETMALVSALGALLRLAGSKCRSVWTFPTVVTLPEVTLTEEEEDELESVKRGTIGVCE